MIEDFAEFLTDLSSGQVNQQLGEQLSRLVEAVQATGKPGSLSIKLTVAREGAMAAVKAQSTVKTPQEPMPSSMFFWDPKKGLSRKDPRQLELKEIAPPKIVGLPKDRKAAAGGDDKEEG